MTSLKGAGMAFWFMIPENFPDESFLVCSPPWLGSQKKFAILVAQQLLIWQFVVLFQQKKQKKTKTKQYKQLKFTNLNYVYIVILQ